MYKIYESTRIIPMSSCECRLAFLHRRFLSTTVVRVHFDGDLVESRRELLNVTLGYFADFRVCCIIAGRRVLGNILHG